MLGNVTASLTPTCGCSEAISALEDKITTSLRAEFRAKYVEFQDKYDAQQALINSVAHEVQDVRECSNCVSPSPPPPTPPPMPPSPSPPPPSLPPSPPPMPPSPSPPPPSLPPSSPPMPPPSPPPCPKEAPLAGGKCYSSAAPFDSCEYDEHCQTCDGQAEVC